MYEWIYELMDGKIDRWMDGWKGNHFLMGGGWIDR